MRVFEITTKNNVGKVIIKFLDDGGFGGIDFTGINLSQEQIGWFMTHLPKNVDSIGVFVNAKLNVAEVLESIDFDAFWNRYDDKARSSKVKTRKVWDRMSRTEQVKAYNYISRYTMNIPIGVCKKYATTYLNDQLWNN